MTRAEVVDLLRADLRQISCPVCVPDDAFEKLLDAFMLVQELKNVGLSDRNIAEDDAEVRALLTQPNLEQGRE